MQIYQALNLEKASFNKNKKFTKLLSEADILEKKIYFDILDCSKSWAREKEEGMTLDTYLKKISSDAFIVFFIDREELDIMTGSMRKTMTLAWRGSFQERRDIEHFAWFVCPTERCYDIADKLFKSVYKTSIADYPYRVS